MASVSVHSIGSRLAGSFALVKRNLSTYVSSLGRWEKYAWLAVGVGFLLIILAIILW